MGIEVTILLYLIMRIGSTFSGHPVSVVQAQGLNAEFLCQHPTDSGTIQWQINGTLFRYISDGGLIQIEGRGNSTEALIMRSLAQYNETEVVCIVLIEFNGTATVERSLPAHLIIQGRLDAVENLTYISESSAIRIIWQAPFSLNLTTAEPDIAYCVDVYNITTNLTTRLHLSSNCSVYSPDYIFRDGNNLNLKDLFMFSITPRSNVEGALNGTTSSINGSFHIQSPLLLRMPKAAVLVSISIDSKDLYEQKVATLTILFEEAAISRNPIRKPDNYSVKISFINPLSYMMECSTITMLNESQTMFTALTINCSHKLEHEQLGLFSVNASNRAGNIRILEGVELSTHYIQNISADTTDVAGEVFISCNFINGADSIGYLAIIYQIFDNRSKVHYEVIERRTEEASQLQVDIATNLIGHQFGISVFNLKQNGLPLVHPASFPRKGFLINTTKEYIEQGVGERDDGNHKARVTVYRMRNDSCYKCIFDDDSNSNSTCVLIIHPCGVSLLYPDQQLYNISVTKFEREEESAVGCIDVSQCEEEHYVAVFYFNGTRGMIEGPLLPLEFSDDGTDAKVMASENLPNIVIIGIVLSLSVLTLIGALVIFLVSVMIYIHKLKIKVNQNEESITVECMKSPNWPRSKLTCNKTLHMVEWDCQLKI